MQMILKVNISKKPELFLLGHMDNELRKTHGRLILYMITAHKYSNPHSGGL